MPLIKPSSLLYICQLTKNKQPNIPSMMIIYWQERNQQKQNKFWKITQNRRVTARQNLILEPKENTIQMTSNLIYSILIPNKQQIYIYRSFSYV